MASVFGEMLTFQRLLQIYPEPRIRLAMLCSKIEDGFATVFRQVVLTRFEQSLHQARREQGELTDGAINELWLAANRPMHGDVRAVDGRLRLVVDVHRPFHPCRRSTATPIRSASCWCWRWCRSTSRKGQVCAAVSGAAVVGRLGAPHVLLAKLGVDVTDPNFWELGLHLLDQMVTEAETLAGLLCSPIPATSPMIKSNYR